MDIKRLIANVEQASNLCLVIGNPRRLLILCYLLTHERMSVSDISKQLTELSQSALSQHLAVLRAENLVKVQKESQTVYYSIADENIIKVIEVLKDIYCK